MATIRKPTSFSLSPRILESIKELADLQDSTKTAALSRAIKEALQREKEAWKEEYRLRSSDKLP